MTEPTRSLRSILLSCIEHIESKKRLTAKEKALVEEGHAALIEDMAPSLGRRPSPHNLQIREMADAGKSTAEIIAAFPKLKRTLIDNTLKRWRDDKRRMDGD